MTKPDQTNLINKCRVELGDLSVNLVSLYYPPPPPFNARFMAISRS